MRFGIRKSAHRGPPSSIFSVRFHWHDPNCLDPEADEWLLTLLANDDEPQWFERHDWDLTGDEWWEIERRRQGQDARLLTIQRNYANGTWVPPAYRASRMSGVRP